MKNGHRHFTRRLGAGVQIALVGALTGVFAGVIVTLYTLLASMTEGFARGYYGFFREHPAFIPLLFLALALGAVITGGVLRALPYIRGSGIPQTEGAMRGLMRFSWYRALTGMFAASLLCIFLGLSAGAEGPSVLIGGAAGAGTSDVLRRSALVRRYQIAGGACAGLAVAFNAPLTGMAFAFEEGLKRFTPEVFVCSFTSVAAAVLVRNGLYAAFSLPVEAYFAAFSFEGADLLAPMFYVYVLLSALLVSLAGVGFSFALFAVRRLFGRMKAWKGTAKLLVPFLLAGAAGLVAADAIGGGHVFIVSLARGSQATVRLFSAPLWAAVLTVTALRLLVTVCNMGAGVPCGAFIPILSVGAGLGALMSLLMQTMGMDAACSDALVVICMAVFFTSVVRAPITGVLMTLELTWDFMFLLPALIGAAAGYLIGDVFRVKPVYERLLGDMLKEDGAPALSFAARFAVRADSLAAGRSLRDVLFPADVRVTRIVRGERSFIPDGNTVLLAGDVLTVEGEVRAQSDARALLSEAVGPPLEE